AAGYWLPATGDRRTVATRDRRPATGDRRPATGGTATGCRRTWLPATGYRLPATGYSRLSATGHDRGDRLRPGGPATGGDGLRAAGKQPATGARWRPAAGDDRSRPWQPHKLSTGPFFEP